MPTITIDGREVTVEARTTIIHAAEKLGIYIPRYCYHPGLSIAGSCRMCMVEIEGMPRLQISCHMQAQDGMKVITKSEKAMASRRAMLEFLLINHPLDCPVCDQAGECDLQNFYMEIGRYDSRFLENKIKRRKAFPIGPHVALDQERCILCSRCVRFCEEISRTNELGVFERGNRSVVDLYPGKALENKYSVNVVDICPVGALTERDFRFQCRVWYLQQENSICTGCARGCNTQIHYNIQRPYKSNGRRILRLKPRFNPYVNRWWMCDEGRYSFEFVNQGRIERPQLRQAGRLEPSQWDRALTEAARAIKRAIDTFGAASVAVIASPQLSNEELYLIKKLFVEVLGVSETGRRNPWEKPGYQDDLMVRADKNPNTRGAEEFGFTSDVRAILEGASSGRLKLLYVFQHSFEDPEALELLKTTPTVVYQGSNWNETARLAHLVLPAATYAEQDGTFTNFEGRIQRFYKALEPLGESRAGCEVLISLAEKLEAPLPYSGPEDLFMEWRGESWAELDDFGEMLEAPAQTP
jgi:NADH-quinone oxidoreductase subunit G